MIKCQASDLTLSGDLKSPGAPPRSLHLPSTSPRSPLPPPSLHSVHFSIATARKSLPNQVTP